ncbi:TonB-dependent receptor [Piscinibacter sakaiensis]|uniref:TonB-dependent receptor n=1 Tax=Piscinibacter sakaiensis TaxID=1547922 RepID=A0A0K8P1H2_PISS1|nr:TonB-dependent receptor [Piscinibacter sakaiensis]GAP36473.1 TonB-dependent receptor [Piscinibacter sakaiensis]
MFRLKHVNRAVFALCAGGLAVGAVAQQQQPAQTLERVEITGSNIKRINAETVAPVEVITREQIQRSGQPTIADVLRTLPSNTGGSFGESFSNSFAPGAAGISLRGLGQKTTLVLLNGRRVTGYGFAQNLQDSFVDLNAIPTSAVERVEILKDGASAIYGSDAIAGVVNIILRRDFKGVDASLTGGTTKGGNEYGVSLTGGFGDLGSDRFNAFGVLDYYKRDYLAAKDTKFGQTRDFRSYQGGRNFESLTGGGTWRELTPAGALTNNYRAIAGCTGTVLTGPQAVERGLINPVGATNIAMAAATNTYCSKDFNDQFTALPGTERIGFLGRGTYEFNADTQAFLELGLSRTQTFQTFQAPFFAGTTGLQATPAGLRPFPYNITFAPGVAGNPFSNNARYTGVLNDMGTRDNDITSDTYRVVGGLKYVVAGWDLETGLTFSRNEVEAMNLNRITLNGTSALFGVGTGVQPPVPVSVASVYNLANPASNSQAVRDSFRANFPRQATSELFGFDTRASTEFSNLRLPGGAVGLAVGVEYREEKLNDRADPLAASGQILGQGITSTNGKRHNTALFAEVALPILKSLEGQLAVRYDKYSDYGSSTNPKVGFKWTPTDMVAFRANWGKGFRAPTLPEISPSVATFFTSVIDPQDDTARNISGVFAGNPNLKAEKSTSATVGVVFEPTKNASVSVDLYRLDWRDVVASRSFQTIIDESCPGGPGTCPSTANVIRDPATGQVVTILSNYQNLASRVTTGADVDARMKFPTTTMGTFGAQLNVTYVRTFKEDGVDYAGSNGGSNTIPRVKAALALNWDKGPYTMTVRGNYTHSVYQQLLAGSYFTTQDPRFQNGVYPDRVGSYTTVDLYGKYDFTKNLSISASIINVFDKTPPYDPGFSSTSLYDFSLHDPRGRRYSITLNYKMN